jgi:hypothetical protein
MVTCFRSVALSGYLGNRSILKQVAAVMRDLCGSYGISEIVKGGFSALNPPTGSREHPVQNLLIVFKYVRSANKKKFYQGMIACRLMRMIFT